jgi:hypothetical protein
MTDVTHCPIYTVHMRARNGDNRTIRHICHFSRIHCADLTTETRS